MLTVTHMCPSWISRGSPRGRILPLVGVLRTPQTHTGLSARSEPLPKSPITTRAPQRQLVLAFIGLVAGPLLALVCAGMGLYLVLTGKTIAGVVFILVLTQLFIGLGLWAYNA